MTTEERFWAKVDVRGPDECWPWLGAKSDGYSTFWVPERRSVVKGYRLMHEWEVGPIPEGHEVHHLCENPACVNPRHLEVVTRQEHGERHRPQLCKRGHDEWAVLSTGRRICRACDRLRHRGRYGGLPEEQKEARREYNRRYRKQVA